ncbi:membrane protein FAM174B [Lampris incognitus]|uniref:membrane protein FAM174B n=1 Tax=Lampris incognitus TaxID=2546036 RepID=UPI0024B625E5|nr:membrane protein FAM174B [Lampris incognitus]
MVTYAAILTCAVAAAAAAWGVRAEPPTLPPSPTRLNATASVLEGEAAHNGTDAAESRVSSLLTYLPALKNVVFAICVLTAVLVTCLVVKIIRSGRRIRKTRKYDIITTPAERVEMAPLNEENDDEDDSTLFDVKYR